MIIYHTTRGEFLDQVLADGLRPRSHEGVVGNFHTLPSKDTLVYFARFAELNYAFLSKKSGPGLVFEVDTDKIDNLALCPDEDAVAEIYVREQGYVNFRTDPAQRAFYEDAVKQFDPRHPDLRERWPEFYERSNLVAHDGPVGADAITRVVSLDIEQMPEVNRAFTEWYSSNAQNQDAVAIVQALTASLFNRTSFTPYVNQIYHGVVPKDAEQRAREFCSQLLDFSTLVKSP